MMMLRAAAMLALVACASAQGFACYKESEPPTLSGNTYTWGKVTDAGPYASCLTIPVTGVFSDNSGGSASLAASFGGGSAASCANIDKQAAGQAAADALNKYFTSNGVKGTGTVGTVDCCEAALCNTGIGGVANFKNSGAAITVNAVLMAVLAACTFLLTSKLV